MKLLITGGCGFLGSNLAAHSLEKGDELVIIDDLSRKGSEENLDWLQKKGDFQFVCDDIRNYDGVSHLVRKLAPDAVFHLAGQVAMTTSIQNPRYDFEVNALGTHNLLEAVRLHAPDAAVIYSSTNKVYGDLEQFSYRETSTRYECIDRPNGFGEDTQLEFHSPYGCSKGAADQYMLDYARIFNLKTVVFRHSSMYGGRQFATYDQGWIGWFCQMAAETKQGRLSEPFTISGSGKQVRDVLHSRDLVALYFRALDRVEEITGQVFNIGGGMDNSLSLLELFDILEEMIGMPLDFRRLLPRASDQKVFVADNTKISGAIGWVPEVGAKEGIGQTMEWVENVLLN
ncbi:MAG: GDP-mannose 4,6-dehydratase [bacterium]|nr:GDP-mannose 4,6-dehydratase [bacterium]